jgi:aminomethyltransferase
MTAADGNASLLRTPLHDCHVALGARMVPFAGYEMPVQYADGVLKEHLWTRERAGLFDVAHMGLAYLHAADNSHDTVARALETLVPADILSLPPGRQRYTQLLNGEGGIIDDLMVARSADAAHEGWLYLVVNAARKAVDFAHMKASLPPGVELVPSDQFALVALQGPAAEDVLSRFDPGVRELAFMAAGRIVIDGVEIHLTRSGYTGEDGFELPLPVADAQRLWNLLIEDDRVRPIGLGARDSLRLEAGLCLYGHDIDETTSPVEAGLAWSIQKRRRAEGGFPGANRIQRELAEGPTRRRVGIRPEGRAPAREGTPIHRPAGDVVGTVTSGGFGPTVAGPVAMGYVPAELATPGTRLDLIVRGKPMPAEVVKLPFIEPSYKR